MKTATRMRHGSRMSLVTRPRSTGGVADLRNETSASRRLHPGATGKCCSIVIDRRAERDAASSI